MNDCGNLIKGSAYMIDMSKNKNLLVMEILWKNTKQI